MEVKAVAKNTGVSVRKMRPLVNMVRGKTVDEALTLLRFVPSPNARIVAKVVKTAAATAENNYQMNVSRHYDKVIYSYTLYPVQILDTLSDLLT